MSSFADHFYVTGGTLPYDASSYVLRQADAELFHGLCQGEFCYVLNTRQIGKSSLMVRTAQRLREQGILVALLDLTAIGQNVTVEEWYDGLLTLLAEQLRMRSALEDFWLDHPHLGPMQRWMAALRHVVLETHSEPICLFVDEIDSVRSLPFSTDEFFAGIRECYNRRVQDPALCRLTFCLLGVATPVDLIINPLISPFNIGKRIVLTDFTPEEAFPLASGLGKESNRKRLLERILYWTGGHPYLTQRLCLKLTQSAPPLTLRQVDAVCSELFLNTQAQETDDNLAFVRNRLLHSGADRAAALDLYRQIHAGKKIKEDATNPIHSILRLSGIVTEKAGMLMVRNRIYAHVFDERWALTNMPDAEVRRQKAAYRRGLLRSASVFGSLAAVITALLVLAVLNANRARMVEARASRLLYIADLNLIQSEWETGNTTHVLDLLAETRDNPERGFEWEYWYRHCHRSLRTFSHAWESWDRKLGPIVFSPDGSSVAGLNPAGLLIVWDVQSGRERFAIATEKARVYALTYTPDSAHLLIGMNKTVQVRDAATGHLVQTLTGETKQVRMILCSEDGAYLVTLSEDIPLDADIPPNADMTVHLWDAHTGRILRTIKDPSGPISALALAGRRLATCTDTGLVRIWDLQGLHQIRSLQTEFKKSRYPPLGNDLALSHDGTRLVGQGSGDILQLLDTRTGRILSQLSSKLNLLDLHFSADDSLILVVNPGMARLWSTQTGRELDAYEEQPRDIIDADISPDGRYIAAGYWDGVVKLWDIRQSCNPLTLRPSTQALWSTHYSPDSARLAVTSSDGCAYVLDTRTGRRLLTLSGSKSRVNVAVFSHDGSRILTANVDGIAYLWDAHTGQMLAHFALHPMSINGAAFTPDDRRIVTCSDDKTIKVLDLQTGNVPLTMSGNTRPVESLDLASDGRTLATGSDDMTANIWDIRTGHLLCTLKAPGEIWSVAVSPDGKQVAIGNLHNTVEVWELATHRLICTLNGHTYWVVCLAFSPDGKRLVTGSRDSTAKVWDLHTGRELLTLRGHQGQISGIAFSPDGKQIATSGSDGNVRLWNTGPTLP